MGQSDTTLSFGCNGLNLPVCVIGQAVTIHKLLGLTADLFNYSRRSQLGLGEKVFGVCTDFHQARNHTLFIEEPLPVCPLADKFVTWHLDPLFC